MGYFGSKATSGLCQAIIAMMPPHDTYIETHLGGGAVMKRKPPALENIGIDLDARALAEFECGYSVRRVHGCAHRFLAGYDFQGSELVYSDPPYLRCVRTSGRRYRFDYEEADHIELLELLKTLPCRVMLSGYPSALYDGLLGGWGSLGVAGDEPGRRAHREAVVQLHPRPGALGQPCGQELHGPAAHQAQGRELGPALPGAAPGGAPRGTGVGDGRRGRGVNRVRRGDGSQGIAEGGIRHAEGALRAACGRRRDVRREPRPVPGPADAVRGADGRVHGKAHPEEQRQLQPARLSDRLRRHRRPSGRQGQGPVPEGHPLRQHADRGDRRGGGSHSLRELRRGPRRRPVRRPRTTHRNRPRLREDRASRRRREQALPPVPDRGSGTVSQRPVRPACNTASASKPMS